MAPSPTTTRSATSFLLFPGRHLANTRFQEHYLKRVLTENPSLLPEFLAGRVLTPPTEVIFAITSANQENQAERGSRVYTNPWIVQNRFEGHAQLFSVGGSPLPWPPTNMVLVAEKSWA